MTKANQVAPMLAMLRGLIPDATEAIGEFAKLAEYVDEVEARAEQAEHSLAASERALAALRYQAQAGGCELSTVGENSYHCRTDALCGLCRLRHRAEQAERSLATVTAERDERHEQAQRAGHAMAVALTERDEARAELAAWHNIARSVGFAHEPYTGPVVVDAAARGAFADWCERNKEAVDGRAAAVDRLKYERDALQAKLAESTEWGSRACEVLGYVLGTLNLCDEQHWAFDPLNVEPVKDKAVAVRLLVRDLRARLAKTEKVVDAARKWSECVERGFAASERPDVARARVLRALRVLDEDSGGSDGTATREDAGTAPSGSERSTPPEPAGSFRLAPPRVDPADLTDEPATRAELEELRREVLETVADVCLRADDNAQAPWPWPLTRLGAELRRRVERLEGG